MLREAAIRAGVLRPGTGATVEPDRGDVPVLRLLDHERSTFERRARERLAHDRESPPDPAGQWRRDQAVRASLQNLDFLPEEH